MGWQAGLNNGVSGLISMQVDGVNGAATQPTFDVRVFGWDFLGHYAVVDRAGRAGAPLVRLGDWNSKFKFHGKPQLTSPPWPTNPQNASGSLVVTLEKDQNNNVLNGFTLPVAVNVQNFSRDEKTTDLWDLSGEATANGLPSIIWQGKQVIISVPAANTAETYAGLSKIYDPNALRTRATTRYDIQGVADNDTSEMSALVHLVASFAPYGGPAAPPFTVGETTFLSVAKVVDAEWLPNRDKNGGQIAIHWALKDTVDDELFPNTVSTRSPIRPWTDSIAVLEVTSGDVSDQATSLMSAAQTQNFFEGMTLTANPVPNLRKFVQRFINPGIGLRARATGPREVQSQILPASMTTSSPIAMVYIMDPPTVGNKPWASGMRQIQLDRIWVTDQPLRRLILTRMIPSTGQVPDSPPAQIGGVDLPTIGSINSTAGSFNSIMGVAPYTVSYNGAFVSTNLSLSGVRQYYMGYFFIVEPLGVVSNIPQRYFNSNQPLVTTYTASGWTPVSSIGLSSITVPSHQDFSAFITPFP